MEWIFHEHEVRVIYSLMNDQRPMIHWGTNHLLARICFHSKTQEANSPIAPRTLKTPYPSDFSSFPPLHEEIRPTTSTVIEEFTCI